MCGIAGLYYRNGRPVDAGRVEAMTQALLHRGPDGGGVWADGSIGLGHRRLAIRDLSDAGRQPFADPTGAVVVSYNGEIYNDAELKAELSRDFGARFRTTCDTEILPLGYLAWGDGLFARIEGMFSLALWDVARQQLLLARDGVGIKPLFYAADANTVRFGSEIKALLADDEQVRSVSPAGLHRFLAMGYVGPTGTTLDDLQQAPPGSVLTFSARETSERRFWTPARAPRITSMDAAVEEFRPLWARVVRDHLVSDVPVGVLQSGGVDSTLVATEASRGRTTPLFTASFAEASFDEGSAAATVARWLGAPLHPITIESADDGEDILSRIVHHYDGQICDEASIALYRLCGEVRGHVTVALTGDGGDEAFAGYPTYCASRIAAGIGRLLPVGLWKALGRATYGLGGGDETRLPPSALASRFAQGIGDGPVHAHTQWRRRLAGFQIAGLYGPLMRDVAGTDPFAEYKALMDVSPGTLLSRCLVADQRFHLPGGLLAKSDAMSMAQSLELRVPFLDRRILDFAGACDDSLLGNLSGGTKLVLRQAARKYGAPESIAAAPKRGFNAPLARMLRTGMRATAEAHLDAGADALADYLDPHSVRAMWRQHRDGEVNHAYALWPILNFGVWQRGLERSAGSGAIAGRPPQRIVSHARPE